MSGGRIDVRPISTSSPALGTSGSDVHKCCCEKESTWLLTSSSCNLMAFLVQFYSTLACQTLEYTVKFG